MHENHGEHDAACSACRTDIFEERGPLWKQREIVVISVASLLFAIGVYCDIALHVPAAAEALYLATALVAGYSIIKNAILGVVRKHRFDMNLLMTVATAGAFAIGHGEEGASVMLLFSLAELLEAYAGERARRSIGALLRLAPETAIVKRGEQEISVHAHEVEQGEIMIVKPGERIPLDGIVTSGLSSVNQAPITGESIPVAKTVGDSVFAGTINEEGFLEIGVTRKSDETTLSRIVQLVEQAQRKKTPTEAFIDRFSRYYTPSVIILAVLVATLPVLLLGLSSSDWFYKSLVLLVIACPCAMAISTPVSMISGLTLAAKKGILIKGGDVIEKLKDTKVAVFDKTGTITEGRPSVTDVISLNGASEHDLVQIAASLEVKSTHPVALAITARAKEGNVTIKPVTAFRSIPGEGLMGNLNGTRIYAGNTSFFEDKGGTSGLPLGVITELETEGKTVVIVGEDEEVVGLIGLRDRIRDTAADSLRALKAHGIKTIMLTGDNDRAAGVVTQQLDLDECYAELLPEDKVRHVEQLVTTHGHVMMIGDGINDAPAMAQADVGVAMGAAGSDVAIETADITLMHDDLLQVPYLISLSEKTMSVVRQNVIASILVKGSFALLTFPGLITLWLAVGVGDMGLSLAVILNALRIGRR